MFTKLNPLTIIKAHFSSLRHYATGEIYWMEIACHLLLPAALAVLHFLLVKEMSEGVAGILVSAASIVAGLMLNLLVLIYTLVYNAKSSVVPITNFDDFKQVADETLSTIAYSILLCLALVLTSFLSLSRFEYASAVGRVSSIYLGVSAVICLLIVLKRCYAIVHFELTR